MGFIESRLAPMRHFLFQNVSFLEIRSQQVKFERKVFACSISMELL